MNGFKLEAAAANRKALERNLHIQVAENERQAQIIRALQRELSITKATNSNDLAALKKRCEIQEIELSYAKCSNGAQFQVGCYQYSALFTMTDYPLCCRVRLMLSPMLVHMV